MHGHDSQRTHHGADDIERGSHTSVPDLRRAILAYVEAHNEEGKTFKWTKTADEILDKIKRFGERTMTVHGARR